MHKQIVLLNDKTIIELDFAKYRDLSVSLRSIVCLCLRHRQIIALLAHIGASLVIRQIILQGYKIPLFILQLQLSFLTIHLLFRIVILLIKLAIFDLLLVGSVVECELCPSHREPLSVSIQSTGKKRLLLDLQYPNYYVKRIQGEF